MSYRNSYMEIDKSIGIIPAEKWRKFCQHAEKISTRFQGEFTITDESITIDFCNSESLCFKRDVRNAFCGDSSLYIIHKTYGQSVASTVSAMFLLFRQDCLDDNPKCEVAGSVKEVQAALYRLRELGIWENGPRCLPALEDFRNAIQQAACSVRAAIGNAWKETDIPDRINIQNHIDEALMLAMPTEFRPKDNEYWSVKDSLENWKRLVMEEGLLYFDMRFGSVIVKDGKELKKYWFRNYIEAQQFARVKSAETGIPCRNYGLSDNRERTILLQSVDLANLPLDPVLEMERKCYPSDVTDIETDGEKNDFSEEEFISPMP